MSEQMKNIRKAARANAAASMARRNVEARRFNLKKNKNIDLTEGYYLINENNHKFYVGKGFCDNNENATIFDEKEANRIISHSRFKLKKEYVNLEES